jgi:hypothetical protein
VVTYGKSLLAGASLIAPLAYSECSLSSTPFTSQNDWRESPNFPNWK